MKTTKTLQNLEKINILITKCEKKPESTQNQETLTKISELTNTEDIKDFYAYTKECLKRFSKITPPTNEELEKIYIESFPFDNELKRIKSIKIDKKLAVFDLDETLVHCITKNISKAEVQLTISSFNSKVYKLII